MRIARSFFGDRRDEIVGEHFGNIDGSRAVRAADNGNGRRLRARKSEKYRSEERDEDPELRPRADQHTLGIGDQRTEIRHRADAEEDERRVDHFIDAVIEIP